MGIFSSETKVIVNTNTVRMIENDHLPNSVKVGAIKSVFEEGDMVDYILEEMIHNITIRANRVYKYAKNNSHLGVPSGTFIQKNDGAAQVKTILESLYGRGGKILYAYFGVPNYYHFGWEALVAKGYDTKTNKLDQTRYLDYFALEFQQGTLASYAEDVYLTESISPYSGYKPWADTSTLTDDFFPPISLVTGNVKPRLLVVSGVQKSLPKPDVTYTRETVQLPTLVSDSDYFQACYEVNGKKYFWSYLKGSGKYSALDSIGETTQSNTGTYYPLIHFIHDKNILNKNVQSADYKLTKKLCRLMDIDADPIFDELKANPDIAQVNQATLMFGIPANTSAEAEQRYGFEFFSSFVDPANSNRPTVSSTSVFTRKGHTAGKSIVIQDKKFSMTISFGAIIKQRKAGEIGGRGDYNSKVGEGTATYEIRNPVTGIVSKQAYKGTVHYYMHQVSPGLYDEIQVVNLRIAYKVFGSYSTTADGSNSLLMLPLDKAIIDKFPVSVREELVARSLRFVFNSYQVQHISFFNRGPFKAFMMVVAVVFTIYSAGAGASFTSAVAAGGTVALTAIWSTVILPILKVALVAESTKFFVKVVGEDAALLFAVLAVAYGAYTAYTNPGSLFADNLLKIGNSLISQAQASIQNNLLELQSEFEEFDEYSRDLYTQLEEASNELLNGNLLAKVPEVIFGESPRSYFDRTVHSGNIGIQSIAAVSNYVDVALKLPTFNDTIQHSFS